jgi:pimeloyl-ACP methyl ester carboxylesterase
MKLNVHEWGTGDRTALLIHGLFADHRTWHRVGPALAERGYRVIAPDLRGHGASPRGEYSPELWAADLVESLPKGADLAIGHSLAGMAIALVAKELAVQRAIYVDPAWRMSKEQHGRFGSAWRGEVGRTEEQWRAAYPRWGEGDIAARVQSMRTFDPACIEGLVGGDGHDHMPEKTDIPALVLVADPSLFVSAEDVAALNKGGFDVEILAGTSHSVFREDFDIFMSAIDAWLAGQTVSR